MRKRPYTKYRRRKMARRPPAVRFEITGSALSEIGLDSARLVDAQGKDQGPFTGLVCYLESGSAVDQVVEFLRRHYPPGWSVAIQTPGSKEIRLT